MATIAEALSIALEHQRQGRMAEAEKTYRQVLDVEANDIDALHLLGVLYSQQGDQHTAVRYISQAIRLQPSFAAAHLNLGVAYRKMGRAAEAIAACRQAVGLDPTLGDAYTTLGTVFQGQGQLDAALDAYARAIEVRADDVDAHQNRALIWLTMGDFERGWAEYEWRWRQKDFYQPPMPKPRWDGTTLGGRKLLVQCEQGLGDTLQFMRYVQLLESQGENTFIVPQPPLIPLLACSGVKGIVPPGSPLPEFDVYCPMMSLPHFLRATLATIPATVPYVAAEPKLVAQWRRRLEAIRGLRIGIAWQGNPTAPHEPSRSIPLMEFERIAIPGVSLISLQKGPGIDQIPTAADRFEFIDLAGELDEAHGPFMDTAAIITSLDLVVTSDTVTAHLAGALGMPVWVALTHIADWRWMQNRVDSPWYPTMRLFRQSSAGDWAGVFKSMAAELLKLASARAGSI